MADNGDELGIGAVGDPLIRDDLVTDRALTEQDPDRLNHGPIAARVLDLVTVSDPPVNVALFGAWGSGKSSFSALLEREVKRRELDIRIVNYNAWTFTGESLQRNFISHTAAELDVAPNSKEGRRYHRGLYQSLRSSALELSTVDWVSLLLLTLGVLIAIVGLIAAIVFIAATLAKQDAVKAIQETIPSVLASSAVTALLVAGVKQILDGARIDTDQSAPTQEQLHETFLDLIDDQTKPLDLSSARRRILFFIDELDRCPQTQVVETLAAIRNYFEAPGCIFVVAADRQVLERAFNALPYENPGDAQNPYYGSASEFFDKIFQYQIPLPPLRGDTLLRFAHDLVATKTAGVWAILREGDGGHLLDQVLYALIPSHVRSPRRVKVLLNAFATNVRVASARGLEWLPRAQEIAKLTALQTEFPLFANDLLIEPHMPSYLLNPASAPDARRNLLETHRLEPRLAPSAPEPSPAAAAAPEAAVTPAAAAASTADAPDDSGVTPTDPTPRATETQAETLKVAQRRLLRAYLVRVGDVPDASRDLLYLSSAGQAVDLEDPELAALIEEQAVDDPVAVVTAAASRTEAVRQRAVRLLAGQILQGFGLERANLVSALLGIARGLEYELGPAADEATNALSVVDKQDNLEDEHLVDVLGVALGASPTSGQPLIDRILADTRLLADPRRLAAVAAIADRLAEPARQPVWARLAEVLPTDHAILDAPLRRLPLPVVVEMVEATADAIRLEASAEAAAPAEAPAFVEALFAAADTRADAMSLAGALLFELVNHDVTPVYAVLRARAPSIIRSLTPREAEHVSLALLVDAPAEDWALWTSFLPTISEEDGPDFGALAATSVFARTTGVETADLAAIVAALLPPLARLDPAALWAKLEPAIVTAIAARPWATGPQAIQTKLYRAMFALAPLGEPVVSGVAALVAKDLVLALQAPTAPHGLVAVALVAAALPPKVIEVVGPALAAVVTTAPTEAAKVRAQVTLAAAMARAGRSDNVATLLPSREEVLAALSEPDVLGPWAAVPPPSDDIRWMAVQLTQVNPTASVAKATVDVFGQWARTKATTDGRTGLLLDLLAVVDDISGWVEAVGPYGVDEPALVADLSDRIQAATQAGRRGELVRNLIALQPTGYRAQQQVADLIIWMLARRTRVDFDLAGRLIRTVGTKHRAARRLEQAFEAAVDAGYKLPDKWIRELRDAGIVTKRKSSWLDRALGKK